jgi:RNA polymerase sigma-70 factor (ECF subfamily)
MAATPEEINLFLEFQKGGRKASEKFVRKFQQNIFNFCYMLLKDSIKAEDSAQETFVKFWLKRRNIREPDKFKNYLFKTASNLCKD